MYTNFLIYLLRCPISNDIKYIGQTRRGIRRKYEHRSNTKRSCNNHYNSWINTLISNKLKPIFEVIEFLPDKERLDEREIHWISFYKNMYDLCNSDNGGYFRKEVSLNHNSKFLKGNKLEDYYGLDKANEIKSKISKSTSGENNPSYGSKNINEDYIRKQVLSNSKKHLILMDTISGEEFIFRNSKEAAKYIGCSNSTIREGKRNNHLIRGRYRITDID